MQDLKVVLLQTELHWEDVPSNLEMFSNQCNQLSQETDLIVLPEMFSTGFSMTPEPLAEEPESSISLNWMKQTAARYDSAICGSLIIKDAGKFYNRFYFVEADGKVSHYDKRHLFSMAGENKTYTAGERTTTVSYKGWNLSFFVCYDLRFPVWSRNDGSVDCMIYVANWPAPRTHAWQSLLTARAIENQCYVLGCNRVGKDENGFNYTGDSQIIDAYGTSMSVLRSGVSGRLSASLSHKTLNDFREKFPVAKDADAFEIITS